MSVRLKIFEAEVVNVGYLQQVIRALEQHKHDLQTELDDARKHKEMLDSENQRLLCLETENEKLYEEIDGLKQQQHAVAKTSTTARIGNYSKNPSQEVELRKELRDAKTKLETRLQCSRASIAVLMDENKELRHELDTAQQIHRHDLERPQQQHPGPYDFNNGNAHHEHTQNDSTDEMPFTQFSKRHQSGNVTRDLESAGTPSIQFSTRPASGKQGDHLHCVPDCQWPRACGGL